MSDDLKRAMQKLEWHTRGYDEDECSRQMSAAEARTILAALREREQAIEQAYWRGSSEALVDTPWGSVDGVHKAIEQARKDEREACAAECDERAAKLDKASADALDAHAKSEFAYAAAISRTDAAAIRARGAR